MDTNKWKSVAVDMETYTLIRAMGQNGFRRPGAMIAKLTDSEVKRIASKNKENVDKFREKLLAEGKKLLK